MSSWQQQQHSLSPCLNRLCCTDAAVLQWRLWRQLVVTTIAYSVKCTEQKAYAQGLELLKKAEQLIGISGAVLSQKFTHYTVLLSKLTLRGRAETAPARV
jgi:hypothetical protein